MSNCKPSNTPCEVGLKLSTNSTQKVDGKLYTQLGGSLLYLTITRPVIAYAVGIVSRYMEDPHIEHWKAAKRILKYIKGTYNIGIEYNYGGEPTLVGYTDYDYASDIDDRNSTSNYILHLGSGPISWGNKKQYAVSLSSIEAEYVVSSKASQEALWLRRVLEETHHRQDFPAIIFYDNQSTIKFAKNIVYHAISKNVEVHHHFVHDLIENEVMGLQFCGSEDQIADIFTKELPNVKFVKIISLLHLKEVVI
ncbi:secreted RxLR effector protein 161-like [Cryptomeria japonica]|uniref:secreted RxLR effector protein 161-like n=1 Tax=Cryptomeria japonica TaxID=3369 RepID=UPI0025AB84C3|nr:secreted RxLR effector protein 161-like [Cryptomeria japonica]